VLDNMKYIDVAKNKKEEYRLTRPGRYIFFLNNYSGRLSINIESKNVEAYLFGLYIGRGSDQFRLNTVQHHLAGKSFSDLLIKGIFYDQSKFIYEGLIKIDKKAQQSHAYQKNQNLIMSEKCFVDSRPFLEILANDVFCTHASTTGQLSQEEMEYLFSRGLNYNQAEKLLVEGFANEVREKIKKLT
jgi:Fe-S cluster assembly protein SufD